MAVESWTDFSAGTTETLTDFASGSSAETLHLVGSDISIDDEYGEPIQAEQDAGTQDGWLRSEQDSESHTDVSAGTSETLTAFASGSGAESWTDFSS